MASFVSAAISFHLKKRPTVAEGADLGSRGQRPRLQKGAWPFFAMIAFTLSGCAEVVETDQARLCRMALPALSPPDAPLTILGEQEAPDGRGVEVAFADGLDGRRRLIACRFRSAGRPDRSDELTGVTYDGVPLKPANLYFLIRFWLATLEARDADPSPLGNISALPQIPEKAAYVLQQAINGLPLASVYALLAAAYSLVYGLVGRINLAFGPLAAAGGYGAALGAMLLMGRAPGPILGLALVYAAFVAATWGFASSRWVFQPLSRSDRTDFSRGDDRSRAVPQ